MLLSSLLRHETNKIGAKYGVDIAHKAKHTHIDAPSLQTLGLCNFAQKAEIV